jgi:hypothetical protein
VSSIKHPIAAAYGVNSPMHSVPDMITKRRRSQIDLPSRGCARASTRRTAAEQTLKITNPAPAVPDGNIENSLCIYGMLATYSGLDNLDKRMPQSSFWVIPAGVEEYD